MTSVEEIFNRLMNATLEPLKFEEYAMFVIPDTDEGICELYGYINQKVWRRPKKYDVVHRAIIEKYELFEGRIILRTFYLIQGWFSKKKEVKITEIQRMLAGCSKKMFRGLYASFDGVRVSDSYAFNGEWRTCGVDSYKVDNCFCTVNTINSLFELIPQSIHKYCGFEYAEISNREFFNYIFKYESHPKLEMISKMGMYKIASENWRRIRWKQNGYKIFGLRNKDELKYLKACYNSTNMSALDFFHKHRDNILKYKLDDPDKVKIYHGLCNKKTYELICPKLLDYIYSNFYQTSIYIDYIDAVQQLGIPLTSQIKYPENFREAHDKYTDMLESQSNQVYTQMIQEWVNESLYKLRYANDSFVITPANSHDDLISESRALNHCVRQYGERYAKKTTSIFLVRKREDVLTPFVTVEVKDNTIKQVKANHNAKPPQEVFDFVREWAKKNKILERGYW